MKFEKEYILWNKWKILPKRQRKVGYKIQDNGCWKWKNNIRNKRYGGIREDNNGKMILAHRYYYEKKYGKIPNGFELDHLCKNTLCVNPDHLDKVTHAVNCQRGKNTKLKNEEVIKIKKLIKYGHKHSFIAKLFNVSRANIYDIEKKNIWKNIPDPQTVA